MKAFYFWSDKYLWEVNVGILYKANNNYLIWLKKNYFLLRQASLNHQARSEQIDRCHIFRLFGSKTCWFLQDIFYHHFESNGNDINLIKQGINLNSNQQNTKINAVTTRTPFFPSCLL